MLEWLAEHEDGTALWIILFLVVAVICFFCGIWLGKWATERMFMAGLEERPIRRYQDGKVVGYALHFGRWVITRASTPRELLRKKEKFIEDIKELT